MRLLAGHCGNALQLSRAARVQGVKLSRTLFKLTLSGVEVAGATFGLVEAAV
jgi:hypothetical protein